MILKILHTGDIHLDSPFSGLDSRGADGRRDELRSAFVSMMRYARDNGADLMLISGDVFDGGLITRETASLLCRELEAFGKPVFISPGNHDCASETSIWKRMKFPKNVHVFVEKYLTSVDLPELNTTVWGYAFTSPEMTEVPIRYKTIEDPDRINLLVCHGDTEGGTQNNPYCPIRPSDLDYFNADYAALGHIHNPPKNGPGNRWCYPGCLEPRAADEPGEKGACMVEIVKEGSNSRVSIQRIRFAKRRYERGELPLSGQSTLDEVRAAVDTFISSGNYGSDTFLYLMLTGYISQSLIINTELLESTANGVYSLNIEDATRPDIDIDALECDVSIRGEVYRRLKGMLESADEREREIGLRALRYALGALSGEMSF